MFDLKQFRIANNLTQTKLAQLLGVSKSMISQVEGGITPLPELWEKRLNEVKLSIVKVNDDEIQKNNLQEAIDITNKFEKMSRLVPVFDQYAHATPEDEWGTPEWLKERQFFPTLLPEDGYYYWFPIKGDSMSRDSRTTIEDGDYVLGRELYRHYWKYPMQLNRVQVWIIIAKDRPVMCKEIIRHNPGTGIITCHSWNPYYQDEDFDLHLDDVIKLYYFKELKREKL